MKKYFNNQFIIKYLDRLVLPSTAHKPYPIRLMEAKDHKVLSQWWTLPEDGSFSSFQI